MTVRTPHRRGVRHARGHLDRTGGNPKISVRFDPENFERINAYAVQVDCSFGEAVRLLTEYAFDMLDREEREPACTCAHDHEART